MKSKYFSPLFGLVAMVAGFTGINYCQALTTTNSDELYSDSLYIQRSSAEIPGSFESSARENQLAQETLTDNGTSQVLESLSDIDEDQPVVVKKAVAPKKKKSSRN